MQLCEYGCGRKGKFEIGKKKKLCCSEKWMSCSNMRRKNSERQKGKIINEETKRKMRESSQHISPWNKGLKNCFSEETIEKMKGTRPDFIPWNKNLKDCFDDDTRKKMSESHKGIVPSNKFNIVSLKNKYPYLFEVEEIRENKDNGEIQFKCKYCRTWFTPTYIRLYERIRTVILRPHPNRQSFLYCSDECKELCPEHQNLVFIGLKNNLSGYGKSGHYFSKKNNKKVYYRSSYELAYLKIIENRKSVLKYEVEPFYIDYIDNDNRLRKYHPDFLVTYKNKKELVEVKPLWKLDEPNVKLKLKAGEQFCIRNDYKWVVITEDYLGNDCLKQALLDIENKGGKLLCQE